MSYSKPSKNGTGLVKDYEEYTTARGITVRVHSVPTNIIRGIKPQRPKPRRPEVEMQLPKGQTQKRWIKEGDPGWEKYQAELEEWEDERDQLQEAVNYCLALKSYSYPESVELSPEILELNQLGMLDIPDNPYVRKFMWLRENVMGQHDELEIQWIVQKLSGIPEDLVDQMKENFRRTVYGKASNTVEDGDSQDSGLEEGSEEQQLLERV